MATAKEALQEARAALASGWTRGLSTRDADGTIRWNLSGLLARLENKHGLQLRDALESEAVSRGAASLDEFAANTTRAEALSVLDAVISKAVAAKAKG